MTEQIEKRRTESIDRLRELSKISKGKYAPAAEADMSEAVKLNQRVQKPTCATIEDYMRLFPRARFFEGSNGRLCASMACGYGFEGVSVI